MVRGTIEVSMELNGGHRFVLDQLRKGSILNVRGIFLEDTVMCDYLATETTTLLELKLDVLREIAFNHPLLEKSLGLFENRVFTKNKANHLDYIRGQYCLLKPLGLTEPHERLGRAIHRRTAFKNIVLKELFEQRQNKKVATISDLLLWWNKKTRGLTPDLKGKKS